MSVVLESERRTVKARVFVALLYAALALGAVKSSKLANWGGFCAAVLMMAGLAWSLTAMVDAIGYVISGLYQFSLLQSYITFAICGGIAWVLFLVSSFMNVVNE